MGTRPVFCLVAVTASLALGCRPDDTLDHADGAAYEAPPLGELDLDRAGVHRPDELRRYLASPAILARLKVAELTVYDAEGTTASICVPGGHRSIGMVYYTSQRGWHLPRAGEGVVSGGPGRYWEIREGR